jgi:hypothetical protein
MQGSFGEKGRRRGSMESVSSPTSPTVVNRRASFQKSNSFSSSASSGVVNRRASFQKSNSFRGSRQDSDGSINDSEIEPAPREVHRIRGDSMRISSNIQMADILANEQEKMNEELQNKNNLTLIQEDIKIDI